MIRDEFYWLSQMNKATIIANSAGGLLKPQLAHVAAKALKEVIDSGKDPANRVKRVIDFEPKLIAAAGTSEVTEIHVGRSSQDMHSTFRVAIMSSVWPKAWKVLLMRCLSLPAIIKIPSCRHTQTVWPLNRPVLPITY